MTFVSDEPIQAQAAHPPKEQTSPGQTPIVMEYFPLQPGENPDDILREEVITQTTLLTDQTYLCPVLDDQHPEPNGFTSRWLIEGYHPHQLDRLLYWPQSFGVGIPALILAGIALLACSLAGAPLLITLLTTAAAAVIPYVADLAQMYQIRKDTRYRGLCKRVYAWLFKDKAKLEQVDKSRRARVKRSRGQRKLYAISPTDGQPFMQFVYLHMRRLEEGLKNPKDRTQDHVAHKRYSTDITHMVYKAIKYSDQPGEDSIPDCYKPYFSICELTEEILINPDAQRMAWYAAARIWGNIHAISEASDQDLKNPDKATEIFKLPDSMRHYYFHKDNPRGRDWTTQDADPKDPLWKRIKHRVATNCHHVWLWFTTYGKQWIETHPRLATLYIGVTIFTAIGLALCFLTPATSLVALTTIICKALPIFHAAGLHLAWATHLFIWFCGTYVAHLLSRHISCANGMMRVPRHSWINRGICRRVRAYFSKTYALRREQEDAAEEKAWHEENTREAQFAQKVYLNMQLTAKLHHTAGLRVAITQSSLAKIKKEFNHCALKKAFNTVKEQANIALESRKEHGYCKKASACTLAAFEAFTQGKKTETYSPTKHTGLTPRYHIYQFKRCGIDLNHINWTYRYISKARQGDSEMQKAIERYLEHSDDPAKDIMIHMLTRFILALELKPNDAPSQRVDTLSKPQAEYIAATMYAHMNQRQGAFNAERFAADAQKTLNDQTILDAYKQRAEDYNNIEENMRYCATQREDWYVVEERNNQTDFELMSQHFKVIDQDYRTKGTVLGQRQRTQTLSSWDQEQTKQQLQAAAKQRQAATTHSEAKRPVMTKKRSSFMVAHGIFGLRSKTTHDSEACSSPSVSTTATSSPKGSPITVRSRSASPLPDASTPTTTSQRSTSSSVTPFVIRTPYPLSYSRASTLWSQMEQLNRENAAHHTLKQAMYNVQHDANNQSAVRCLPHDERTP